MASSTLAPLWTIWVRARVIAVGVFMLENVPANATPRHGIYRCAYHDKEFLISIRLGDRPPLPQAQDSINNRPERINIACEICLTISAPNSAPTRAT